jgi:hypothetical protein
MAKPVIGHLHKHPYSRNTIFLCPELFAQFKEKPQLIIRFGQKKITARLKPSHRPGHVYLSSNLMANLKIPFEQKVHFALTDNQLAIGPLVGLFVANYTSMDQSIFPKNPVWLNRFLLASLDVPSYYFIFYPQDIDMTAKEINAYFLINLKGKHIWQRHRVPFPDVIYNRVINRMLENSPPVQLAKSLFKRNNIPYFNPDFFNKWAIHEKIHADARISHYLPETIVNPHLEQIAALLQRYPMVYLKPSSGSLGLGIAQLYHLPQQGYLLRYRRGNQNKLFRFKSLSKAIRHFMQHKSSKTYIAQQGIELITINRRPIDFRVHTNKNKTGQWEVTAIGAKLAGKGSVTTHVRTGGEVISPQEAIRSCFPSFLQERVFDELHQAAITLSQTIDEHTEGFLGELGFDLGIDKHGNVWMFEANSKPGRHVFVHPDLRESERITRKKILEYALYLAKFTSEDVR